MRSTTLSAVAAAVAIALGTPAVHADSDLNTLRQNVETLQKQLEQVQKQLKDQEARSASKEELQQVRKDVASAVEWKNPNTLIHMAGYADVGYTNTQTQDGSFKVGSFSPIFHFQYRDLVMLESELEFGVADDGSTDVALEYTTIDFFLNDYAALVAGKFLSPIGQFRQNLHPSWINKLPAMPPGFGEEGGAAPVSETGLQLRGGFPIAGMRSNYAIYVANGPELTSTTDDGTNYALEDIEAEGFGTDSDGKKVYGGRFGLIPMPGVELGVSGATGKAAVTTGIDESGADPVVTDLNDEKSRDYTVIGADFNWLYKGFHARGEFVKTRIDSANSGLTRSSGATWKTWYAEAAYRFLPTKWESVVRYTDFDSAVDSNDQKQVALGVNYLFTNNFIAKVAYEFNDGQKKSTADDNRFLAQLAYGF